MRRIQTGDEVYLTRKGDHCHVVKCVYLGENNDEKYGNYIHIVELVEEVDLNGNVVKTFNRNKCRVMDNFMHRSLQDAIDSLYIYDILE